jgi:hypothetical protein
LFRLVINILILLALIRLMRPLFVGARRFLARFFAEGSAGGAPTDKNVEYPDLTPYEIEDAEYEEFRDKQNE